MSAEEWSPLGGWSRVAEPGAHGVRELGVCGQSSLCGSHSPSPERKGERSVRQGRLRSGRPVLQRGLGEAQGHEGAVHQPSPGQ